MFDILCDSYQFRNVLNKIKKDFVFLVTCYELNITFAVANLIPN